MPRMPRRAKTVAPREIARDVYWLVAGRGLLQSNVYLVRSGPSWVLIDAASSKCGPLIQSAAESLFGKDLPPASILLTHAHPDHAGSARELALRWRCTVWAHPDELPIIRGGVSTFQGYANPLDRWVILPLLRIMGPRRTQSILSQASFKDVACPFDPGGELPGLPDWEAVASSGHTPGHVAFFRRSDRVLVTGDALVTVPLNSMWSLLLKRRRLSGPPWYTTWDWRAAKETVASLAGLEPLVLAPGHGIPMAGPDIPGRVRALAKSFGLPGNDPGNSRRRWP